MGHIEHAQGPLQSLASFPGFVVLPSAGKPSLLSQALWGSMCIISYFVRLQECAMKSFMACTFLKFLINLAKDLLESGPIFPLPGMCEN